MLNTEKNVLFFVVEFEYKKTIIDDENEDTENENIEDESVDGDADG